MSYRRDTRYIKLLERARELAEMTGCPIELRVTDHSHATRAIAEYDPQAVPR